MRFSADMDVADRLLLDTDGWFSSLPPDRRAALIDHARLRSVAAGASIYGIGDAPNGLWAVLAGEVRLTGHPVAGHQFLALIVRPGTWFGEVSTLDGGPRPHDAVAFGPARMLHVSMPVFHRLAEAVPALYHDLGRLVCQHQRAALDFIAQAVSLPLGARLAKLLLDRTRADEPVLRLRQEDVAAMLSVSRQTLNRQLARLVAAGVVRLAYARIEVVDRAGLAGLAAG
jgi:CRP/FNR family cyclic AMP-dependent transcriptional regulator